MEENKKLVTKQEILSLIKKLKLENKKIVFTNGCFDILHPGHVYCLKEAKKRGDILIVGLNSDSSIKKIKGKNRPFFKEEERIMMLSAIEFIDFIILFSEETPYELIKMIKPDVLIKGGSYKKDDVVGKNIVEENNGIVEIIPNLKSYSTTNIVNMIISRNKQILLDNPNMKNNQ